MQQFRNLKNSILFKIFAAFIALSFILFGVSNFLMAPTQQWIAKIDNIKITHRQMQEESRKYRNLISRQLSQEQFDLYTNSGQFQQDILNNLLNKEFSKLISGYFNFRANTDLTLQSIINNSQFFNDEGNFDRSYFNNFLEINSINEDEYITHLNDTTSSNIISHALTDASPIHTEIAIEQEKSRNQTRYVDLLIIDKKNIKKIDKITDDEILQYYDINKKNFVNDERRIISYLAINTDKISQQIIINNEQALQFYKNNIDQYQTRQSRDIFQAIFDNKKQAEIFLNKFEQEIKVKDKKSVFIKYAKTLLNKDKKSIEIKNITQDQLVPELIDKIFSLKINDHSKVEKTSLGYHIILLNKINKSDNKKFKIAKKDIIAQLKKQKTKEVIQKKLIEVEEDMILNNSIKETATKYALKYSKKPININISGQDINNKIPTIIANNNNLLKQIFSLQEDQFSQPVISKDQKYYYIIKINKIIPQHQKSLEDVKSEIANIIKNNKFTNKLEILGQKIFQDLENNTKNINNIAKKYSAKLIKNKKIKRTDSTLGLLNKEIFKLNINQISSPLMIENNKFYIALLRKIHEAPIKNSKKSAIVENDKYRFKSEIMQQFNKYISNKYHIKINPKYKP